MQRTPGIIGTIRDAKHFEEISPDSFTFSDFEKMLEEIFYYVPEGRKMLIYGDRCWRTSPLEISDKGDSGPWRSPTDEEIKSLPKLLRGGLNAEGI